MSPEFASNLPNNQPQSMDEISGPGTCVAGHGFRAATPRPAKLTLASSALGPPEIHHLGVQNFRDVDTRPISRDLQRPPISLNMFEYVQLPKVPLLWPLARVHEADLP